VSCDAMQSYLCFCLGFAIDLSFYGHFRDVVSIAHSCEPLLLSVFFYALRNRFGARYLYFEYREYHVVGLCRAACGCHAFCSP
jgi:hypothetical protein